MTARLASTVIRGMSYSKGYLTLMFKKYDRVYECTTELAYKLAYSDNPTAFFNTNIKNKLRVVNTH